MSTAKEKLDDIARIDLIEATANSALQTKEDVEALAINASSLTQDTNNRLVTDALLSKLNGIESGATGDMTASEILTAIKTVDGSGSGLDADLLDGKYATSFPQKFGKVSDDLNTLVTAGMYKITSSNANRPSGSDWSQLLVLDSGNDTNGQLLISYSSGRMWVRGGTNYGSTWTDWNEVWHAGNDGIGSGLDADLLDGMQPTTTPTPNTIVQRDINGHVNATRVQIDNGLADGGEIVFKSNGYTTMNIDNNVGRLRVFDSAERFNVSPTKVTSLMPFETNGDITISKGSNDSSQINMFEAGVLGTILKYDGDGNVFQILCNDATYGLQVGLSQDRAVGDYDLKYKGNQIWHSGNQPTVKSENGYIRLANGLIIQWKTSNSSLTDETINFPINFPNGCWNVQVTTLSTIDISYANIYSISNSSVRVKKSVGHGVRIFAIGY